jgi:capsular polysaccharide transport system permease protein
MLNEIPNRETSGVRGLAQKARTGLAGAIAHGRANIHDVSYQLRLSFAVVVLLPTVIAAVFYLLIAAPRYVATAQFAVWTASPPKADPLTMLIQLPSSSASLEDQHIVQDYVESRSMLEAVEHRLDLGHIYGTGGDIFSELWPGHTVEERVAYWKHHVSIIIDSTSGISTLEVDAFRPEDALLVANTVLSETQTMVRTLSDAGDLEAARHAKRVFDDAAAHLSDVRAKVTRFRRENRIVDAAHSGQFTSQMVGSLETSLADVQAQIQQLRSYLAPNDPRIAVLQARADSLRRQIDLQKNGLSEIAPTAAPASSPDVLPASVLAKSEALETELDIATKTYAAAATTYFEAQGNLTRNHRYLETFVKPALPEKALRPERLRMIATVLVSAFIAWCLLITVAGAIRDHSGV